LTCQNHSTWPFAVPSSSFFFGRVEKIKRRTGIYSYKDSSYESIGPTHTSNTEDEADSMSEQKSKTIKRMRSELNRTQRNKASISSRTLHLLLQNESSPPFVSAYLNHRMVPRRLDCGTDRWSSAYDFVVRVASVAWQSTPNAK